MRWGADHQREALLGGGQLRDVVLWVGAADVLLHGAVPLLLCSTACYSKVWGAVAELAMTWVWVRLLSARSSRSSRGDSRKTHPSAALATGRVVMVAQRTDDNVVLVRNRERPSERSSRRHGQHLSAVSVRVCGSSPKVQGAGCRLQVEAAGGVWGVNGTCRALQCLNEAMSELENGSQKASSCGCSCSCSAHQAPQAKAGRG